MSNPRDRHFRQKTYRHPLGVVLGTLSEALSELLRQSVKVKEDDRATKKNEVHRRLDAETIRTCSLFSSASRFTMELAFSMVQMATFTPSISLPSPPSPP